MKLQDCCAPNQEIIHLPGQQARLSGRIVCLQIPRSARLRPEDPRCTFAFEDLQVLNASLVYFSPFAMWFERPPGGLVIVHRALPAPFSPVDMSRSHPPSDAFCGARSQGQLREHSTDAHALFASKLCAILGLQPVLQQYMLNLGRPLYRHR